MMVRDFQSIIGEETKVQLKEKEGRGSRRVVACVGGGSNAIGMFAPFAYLPENSAPASSGWRLPEKGWTVAATPPGRRRESWGAARSIMYLLND